MNPFAAAPPLYQDRIDGQTQPPRLHLVSDLDVSGAYRPWHLSLNSLPDGSWVIQAGYEAEVQQLWPMAEVDKIYIEELRGRSRLMLSVDGSQHCVAYYSHYLLLEFAAFCRALEQARKGNEPLMPLNIDPHRDPNSGEPLSDRGGHTIRGGIDRVTLRRLLSLLAPYKLRVTGQILLTFLSAAMTLIPPLAYMAIADQVIGENQTDKLLFWVGVMLVAHLGAFACNWGSSAINAWLSLRVVGDLRSRLHDKLQRLRMDYHTRNESGELVGRTTSDTASLLHFLVDGLPWMLVNLLTFIALSITLITLSPSLALWVFIPVPLIVFGGIFFKGKLSPLAHRFGNRTARLHSHLGESIRGVKTVKASRQEDARQQSFEQVNEDLVEVGFHLEKTWLGFAQTTALLMSLGTVMVWYVGTGQVLKEAGSAGSGITLGTLLAFVGYIATFYGPLQWFAAVANWMARAMAGAERVFQILDMPDELSEQDDRPPVSDPHGDIHFDEVHFSYERGKEVLRGLNFTVKGGEMVGLVGRSGAGKSTIINLICRFFDPTSGSIRIGEQNLEEVNLTSWRQQVGIVMQEPFLFDGTLLDNIKAGRPEASFDEVLRAAKAAHAHEFIMAKDDGYDTRVGESGVKLSGGQRQRISIARAILADPPILILDEATSAVDSETEKSIQEALERLVEGRTTIAIAHRLATLRHADRLLVIDEGQVSEQGTHAELLDNPDGVFSKLVRLQQEINELRSTQEAYRDH